MELLDFEPVKQPFTPPKSNKYRSPLQSVLVKKRNKKIKDKGVEK